MAHHCRYVYIRCRNRRIYFNCGCCTHGGKALPVIPKPKRFKPERGAFKTYPDKREVCYETARGREEYNLRRDLMAERQNGCCCLCGKTMMPWTISFEHEISKGHGGAKADDRIEANGKWINGVSHGWCNVKRGSTNSPFLEFAKGPK